MKKITIILTAVLCIVLFAGCHEKEKAQMQADAAAFCQDFKEMKFDDMYALTNDGTKYFNDIYVPGAESNELIFKSMADNMEYEIGECTIDGKNASVKAKISNVNMNLAMSDVLNEYFAQCDADPDNIDNIDINKIIDDRVNSADAERRDADTVFNFVKKDGKWVIESNVMIYDDVTGGYMSYAFQANMSVNANFGDINTETTTK